MKHQETQTVGKGKVFVIAALFALSFTIVILGVSFSVYSMMNDVSFLVLSSQIHGAVFGLVIVFLGVRYVLSVRKLKEKVYKADSMFSWSNFKRRG